jgi:hypothetical protein
MQNAKVILEAADRYIKARENNSPVDQASALNEFYASLNSFILDALKEQKKNKSIQARASYR